MSLLIVTAEEKKMVEFLKAKGITTLEQLKATFKRYQDENLEEEVVFVKQLAGPTISQEKINQIIQASTRNKEKILDVLSKTVNTAENSRPQPQPSNQKKDARQNNATAVLGDGVVNTVNVVDIASLMKNEKNATSLPLRYRHKNSPRSTKQTRNNLKLQQQERIRQAAKQNELQMDVNIGHNEFNQYSQCIHPQMNQSSQNQCEQHNENNHLNQQPIYNANALNHHTFQGAEHNIAAVYHNAPSFNNANAFSSSTSFNNGPGFNNTTNYNNATDFNNGTGFNNATSFNKSTGFNNATGYNSANGFKTTNNFDNSIGKTIQVTQPISTPVYNGPPQQTWPTATSLHTGQSYNNNFRRFEFVNQTHAQQPCSQYVMGNRPIFDPN